MRFLFVLSLAAAVALAPACRGPQKGVRIDPALATLVPSDTVMLAGVKVESIRQTPLYAKYIEGNELLRVDELAQKTGFDPRKDLWDLLVASDGKEALVFVRGRFSPLGREPKPGGDGVERMTYKGYNLLGDEQSAVLFMNASTAVAGPTPALHALVDTREQQGGVPAALERQLETLRPQSHIWAVALGGDKLLPILPRSGNASNLARMLAEVQTSTLSIDLGNGLDLVAEAHYSSEQSAKQTSDALRGLLGIARLSTPNDEPDLLQAYDNIQVQQTGTVVKVNAQLAPPLIDKLAAVGRKRLSR